MLLSLTTGLLLGASLIIAIGAQNAWVLNQSLRGMHPWPVGITCMLIDVLLITVGVHFIGSIQHLAPALVPALTWLGIGLILWLASQSFWRALRPAKHGLATANAAEQGATYSIASSVSKVAALSLLNPHVYLDTVVLLGSVGSQQPSPLGFVLGASLASIGWFSALVLGGKALKPYLQQPKHWQMVDGVIGCILVLVAASLLPLAIG